MREVAKAVGRSVATISRIERGRIRPSWDLAQAIFRFLLEQENRLTPSLRARDVMSRDLVTVEPSASLSHAIGLMERRGFSQLPVAEGGRVVGAISETTLLRALADPRHRHSRVADVQEPAFPQVAEEFPVDLLATLLTRYPAVLVAQKGELRGIVTRIDLIRGLRNSKAGSGTRPLAP